MIITQIKVDDEWVTGEPKEHGERYRKMIATGPSPSYQYLIHNTAPAEIATINLTNISCEGAEKVGNIWWIPVGNNYNLTADVSLLDSRMMVMLERVVRDEAGRYQTVSDKRVIADIKDGVVTITGSFNESGNYRLNCTRLNLGLEEIGASFRLDFPLIEFDAYE